MAGLANPLLSPTDTQSPKSAGNGQAMKFRGGRQSPLVFDAVLKDRQPAEAKKIDRGPFDAGYKKPPALDRGPGDRKPLAVDNSPRNSAATEKRELPAISDPAKPDQNLKNQANESASAPTAEKKGNSADIEPAGNAEPTGQLSETGENDASGFQIDIETLDIEGAADDLAVLNPDKTETASPPPPNGNIVNGNIGEDLDLPGQTAGPASQIGAEEVIAAELAAQTEAETGAPSGLPAKDIPNDATARQAAPAIEAATANARKGAAPIAPQPNGPVNATNAADAEGSEGGEGEADTSKPRPAATNGPANAARIENAAKSSSNATFAAELGQAPRPSAPVTQTPPGNAPTAQIEAGAALFRASAPTAQNSAPNLPIRAIALHIANRAASGASTFQIRLDPPQLGRIDVKLEIARDGRVSAQLTVDRPETLEALQRDQRGLERTLQNAGLDTKDDGLSFNLRQDADAGAGQNEGEGNLAGTDDSDLADTAENPAQDRRPQFIGLSAVDIRV